MASDVSQTWTTTTMLILMMTFTNTMQLLREGQSNNAKILPRFNARHSFFYDYLLCHSTLLWTPREATFKHDIVVRPQALALAPLLAAPSPLGPQVFRVSPFSSRE